MDPLRDPEGKMLVVPLEEPDGGALVEEGVLEEGVLEEGGWWVVL